MVGCNGGMKMYSPEKYIHHGSVSNRVVIERLPVIKPKTQVVSIGEAYYHLHKWKFVGLLIDDYQVNGQDLWDLALRMLRYRCQRDPELIDVVKNEVGTAFKTVTGGGKVLTRIQGGVILKPDATSKDCWAIIRTLAKYSYNPKKAHLYVELS